MRVQRDVAHHHHLVVVGLERDGEVLRRDPRGGRRRSRAYMLGDRAAACARRPSRSGSSPIASRISRTARSIRVLSTVGVGVATSSQSVTPILHAGWSLGLAWLPRRRRCARSADGRDAAAARTALGSTPESAHVDVGEDRLHPLGLERLVLDQLRRERGRGRRGSSSRIVARDRVRAVDRARAPRRRCSPRPPRSSRAST